MSHLQEMIRKSMQVSESVATTLKGLEFRLQASFNLTAYKCLYAQISCHVTWGSGLTTRIQWPRKTL